MRALLFAGLALSATGCATAPPSPRSTHAAADVREVVAVAEALFSAMRARDTAAVRGLFVPEARIVSVRVDGASAAAPRGRSVAEFVASLARPGDELRERIWDPRVEVDGDLAALWAPYDFHVGESFSHCGHDAFHLVRQGGEWKITALAYTVRTTGCAAPAAAQLSPSRPAP